MKKLIMLPPLFLCLLMVLAACASGPTAETPGEAEETPTPSLPEIAEDAITITAEALFSAYEENEVAADARYEDKILIISGTIDSIGKNLSDSPYITFRSGTDFNVLSIQCFFPRSAEVELAKLSPGQLVFVQGKCEGKSLNVIVEDCSIISVQPDATAMPPAAVVITEEQRAELESLTRDFYASYNEGQVKRFTSYLTNITEEQKAEVEATSLIGVKLTGKGEISEIEVTDFTGNTAAVYVSVKFGGETKSKTWQMVKLGPDWKFVWDQGPAEKPEEPAAEPENVPIKVSAEDLDKYYHDNEVLADSYFRDKILKVPGTVASIGVSGTKAYIMLYDGDEYRGYGVQCFFTADHNTELSQLSKEQQVVIQGKCNGLSGFVELENCSLISVAPPPTATPEPVVEETVEITARDLYKAFMKDKAAASATYMDEEVIVTGRIIDVGVDMASRRFASLSGEDLSLIGVNCYAAVSQSMSEVKTGQEITFKGTVSGYTNSVEMKDCIILEE